MKEVNFVKWDGWYDVGCGMIAARDDVWTLGIVVS